jgi:tetratricopeptide (TPR) repeat protein
MKTKWMLVLVLGAVAPLCLAASKPLSVELREARYTEEMKGDLDQAIKLYEKIAFNAEADRRYIAEALFRLGTCYAKKGIHDKAEVQFNLVITQYADQTDFVARAQKEMAALQGKTDGVVAQAVKTISTCAEGDPKVKAAIDTLKGHDSAVVVTELTKHLDSQIHTIRRAAIYILWQGQFADIQSAVVKLTELCKHPEDLTRGMAALTLGQNKVISAYDALCSMTATDLSPYARRCGAYALGLLGKPEAKSILEKAAQDPDTLVSDNAKAALDMLNQSKLAAPITGTQELATDSSDGYNIKIDRIQRCPSSRHDTEMTGFPMIPQQTSGDSWSDERSNNESKTIPGVGSGRAQGFTSAGGGGMGGGIGGSYTAPNLALQVKVDHPNTPKGRILLCEVDGKVTAHDNQGHELTSPGFPASLRMRMQGIDYPEGSGRTAIHLYQPKESLGADSLQSVEGHLLLLEAKQTRFEFTGEELLHATTKKNGSMAVQLMNVKNTADGSDVTVAVAPTPLKKPMDPSERMRRLQSSQGRLAVVLVDTDGRIYPPAQTQSGSSGSSQRSGGSSSGMSWGSASGSGHASWGPGGSGRSSSGGSGPGMSGSVGSELSPQETHERWPTTVCRFAPLPTGAKLKAVRCTITDQVGEPRSVAFSLKDIPLPRAADNEPFGESAAASAKSPSLSTISAADKKETEKIRSQAWQLWQQQKFAEAEPLFQQAVEKDPTNANAWNGMVWTLFNLGRPEAAKEAFTKCIEIDPKQGAAFNGLGWIAKGQRQIDEAIRNWEQALKVLPNGTAAMNGLATTYMEKQDYAKAAQMYQRWLKVEPNSADAKAGLEKANAGQ